MTEVASVMEGYESRGSSAGFQPCRIQVTRADGSDDGEIANMMEEMSVADSAIEAASSGCVPRALRVEELIFQADKNISRSGSYSSLSGDTSGTDGDVDSRPNSGECPVEPPTDELVNKIVDQVEFYFSDENILKDAFLLKHVRRNKQGFVSLKLITSFKRIKSLTKDYRVVAIALREGAKKLEVNAEGTKVKRVDPLPDYDETSTSRTVIAMHLPLAGEPTFDNVANLFSHCGEIVLIRIVKHGGVVPSDLKQYIHKHPEIGNETCAVIEFDSHAAAQRACAMGVSTEDDGGGGGGGDTNGGEGLLRVALLQPPKSKKSPLAKGSGGGGRSGSGAATANGDDGSSSRPHYEQKKDRKLKKKNDRLAAIANDSPSMSSAASDSESEFLSPHENDVGVRNGGRHSHHRQPHSNKENSPGRADRQGNWRSPTITTTSSTTASPPPSNQDKGGKGNNAKYTPGSSPANTPKSTPRSSPQQSPRMQRRSGQNNQQQQRPNSGTESPSASQPGRRSGARPSPMSSPEAIRRRRSAGAMAQQQQQQGLVVGVSPLAQEGAGSRSPPSGSSPPRATGDADKPPVHPLTTAGGDLGMSPWVQRRLQAAETTSGASDSAAIEGGASALAAATGTASPGRSNSPAVLRRRNDAPPRLLDSLGVVRQPRGPDGSKGFHPGVREAIAWPPLIAVS